MITIVTLVGAERIARSRLPDSESGGSAIPREPRAEKLALSRGFAPRTLSFAGRDAKLLHLESELKLAAPDGIAPSTSGVRDRRSAIELRGMN